MEQSKCTGKATGNVFQFSIERAGPQIILWHFPEGSHPCGRFLGFPEQVVDRVIIVGIPSRGLVGIEFPYLVVYSLLGSEIHNLGLRIRPNGLLDLDLFVADHKCHVADDARIGHIGAGNIYDLAVFLHLNDGDFGHWFHTTSFLVRRVVLVQSPTKHAPDVAVRKLECLVVGWGFLGRWNEAIIVELAAITHGQNIANAFAEVEGVRREITECVPRVVERRRVNLAL